MISASEVLQRLQHGNRRFVESQLTLPQASGPARRADLVKGQAPSAVILGCSDSRVPAEIIFDQGLGELFVVRVAGNLATSTQIGSVEFAAAKFGTPLVVVLGHSQCGAVRTTLDQLTRPAEIRSPHLRAVVEGIRPAVEPLMTASAEGDPETLMGRAIRANTEAAVNQLLSGSELLRERVSAGELAVIGAEYSLETGEVDFFSDGEED